MYRNSQLLLVLFALIFAVCVSTANSEEETEIAKCKETERVDLSNGTHYLLNVPEEYKPDETWGIILMLHGQGGNNEAIMNAFLYGCEEQQSFLKLNKLIGVAPHSKEERWGKEESTPMLALLDVLTKYKVDRKRIHLTGTSAGGFFSGWLGYNRPDIFRTVTIIAASMAYSDKRAVKKYKNRPVYFILGETDPNLKMAKKDFKKITKQGNGFARLRILDGQGHKVKFWDDFANLGRYYKAIESGYDYPTNLKNAEDNVKKNISKAMEMVKDISLQPVEDVFSQKLAEIKEMINNAGEKKLSVIMKRFSKDNRSLQKKLTEFTVEFTDYPVSDKAKLEIARLESLIPKKPKED